MKLVTMIWVKKMNNFFCNAKIVVNYCYSLGLFWLVNFLNSNDSNSPKRYWIFNHAFHKSGYLSAGIGYDFPVYCNFVLQSSETVV